MIPLRFILKSPYCTWACSGSTKSNMPVIVHHATWSFLSTSANLLLPSQNFDLGALAQLLAQSRADLVCLLRFQLFLQSRFYIRVFHFAGRNVLVEANDGVDLSDLQQVRHLAGLHRQQNPDRFWRDLGAVHGFVVSHHHPVVVFGDLFRQHAELFVVFSRFSLGQCRLGALARLFHLLRSCLLWRNEGNGLNCKALGITEARRIAVVVGPELGRRHNRFVSHFDLQQLVNQQRAADLLAQALFRPIEFALQECLIPVWVAELIAKILFRLFHLFRGHRHLPPQGFLVDQFLEDDYLHGAIADSRLHVGGNSSAMLTGIRKYPVLLAPQVAVCQNCSVDSGNGPAGWRKLRGGLQCALCRGVGGYQLGRCQRRHQDQRDDEESGFHHSSSLSITSKMGESRLSPFQC